MSGRARIAVVAIVVAVLVAIAAWLVNRTPGSTSPTSLAELPPPADTVTPAAPARSEFVGAERCASCHATQYAAWRGSTHGTAGGVPGSVKIIAPFNGTAIRFRDAEVIPATGRGYTFTVRQAGRPDRVFTVDGVVGGGHMVGGGTQSFVSRFPDGTWRLLPFDWSRQTGAWFCNTATRADKGWTPITTALVLADCGDWPPQRVLGDEPRFTNCQQCHASQLDVRFDSASKRWDTKMASLAINCESCHGPAKRHVDLMTAESTAGASVANGAGSRRTAADIGLVSLATLDKDQSLVVCFQCHALKSQLATHYLPGASLTTFYALRLAQLGDAALLPDGRTRTFAYQEGHLSSACYLKGGMTCTSCHDPHSQGYRDAFGAPLVGRFDDRQCTSCHASKAVDPSSHTKHAASSEGSRCTSCHMPYHQELEIGTAIRYARSDHTISIPRPAFDSSQGLTSACKACHADRPVAVLEQQVKTWYGTVAPHDRAVASVATAVSGTDRSQAAKELLDTDSRHTSAVYAGLARFVEQSLGPDMPDLEPAIVDRLRTLSGRDDPDVRATALAALHFARGTDPETRRFLASTLRSLGAVDGPVRARWSAVLGFLADNLMTRNDAAGAVATYRKALEITPRAPRVHLSMGFAQARAGDLTGAIASYRRSLELDSQQPLVLVNLGIALESSGDPAGAEQAYRRATTIDPNEPLAYFNLGNVYLKRGDVAGAIPLYERATSLNPSLSAGYLYLADAYARTGATRKALDAVRRGLEFDPTNADARRAEVTLEQALGIR